MSKFIEQVRAIVGDIVPTYSKSFATIDTETDALVREMAYQMIYAADGDVAAAINNVASGYCWWFLVGREHALRGYPPPLEGDPGSGLVPDDPRELLDDAT